MTNITIIQRAVNGVSTAVHVREGMTFYAFLREHMPYYRERHTGTSGGLRNNYVRMARGPDVRAWPVFNLYGLIDSIEDESEDTSRVLVHGDVIELSDSGFSRVENGRRIELYNGSNEPPYQTVVAPGTTLASIIYEYVSMGEHAYVRIERVGSDHAPVYALNRTITRGRSRDSGLSPILEERDRLYLLDENYTGAVENAEADARAQREDQLMARVRLQTQQGGIIEEYQLQSLQPVLQFLSNHLAFSDHRRAHIFSAGRPEPRATYTMPNHTGPESPLLEDGDLIVMERMSEPTVHSPTTRPDGRLSVVFYDPHTEVEHDLDVAPGTQMLQLLGGYIAFANYRRAYILNENVVTGRPRATFSMSGVDNSTESPLLIHNDRIEMQHRDAGRRRYPQTVDADVSHILTAMGDPSQLLQEGPAVDEPVSANQVTVSLEAARFINRASGGIATIPVGTNLHDFLSVRVPFRHFQRAYIQNEAVGPLPRLEAIIPFRGGAQHELLLEGDHIVMESNDSERLFPDPTVISLMLDAGIGEVNQGGLARGAGPHSSSVGTHVLDFLGRHINFNPIQRVYVFNAIDDISPRVTLDMPGDGSYSSEWGNPQFIRGDVRIEMEVNGEERRYPPMSEEEDTAVAEAAAPEDEAEAEASEDATPDDIEADQATEEAAEAEATAPTPVAPPSHADLRARSQEAQRLGLLLLTYQNGTFGLQDESGNMERVDFTTFDSMEGFLRAFRLGADHQSRRPGGMSNGNGNGNGNGASQQTPQIPEAVFGSVAGSDVPQQEQQRQPSGSSRRQIQQLQAENEQLRQQSATPRGRRNRSSNNGGNELEAQRRVLQTSISNQCTNCSGGDTPKKESDGHWWHYGRRAEQTVRCPAEALHQQLESLTATGQAL